MPKLLFGKIYPYHVQNQVSFKLPLRTEQKGEVKRVHLASVSERPCPIKSAKFFESQISVVFSLIVKAAQKKILLCLYAACFLKIHDSSEALHLDTY